MVQMVCTNLKWDIDVSNLTFELKSCDLSSASFALLVILPLTGAGACGPISQNEFLHKLGIRQRIEVSLMAGLLVQ